MCFYCGNAGSVATTVTTGTVTQDDTAKLKVKPSRVCNTDSACSHKDESCSCAKKSIEEKNTAVEQETSNKLSDEDMKTLHEVFNEFINVLVGEEGDDDDEEEESFDSDEQDEDDEEYINAIGELIGKELANLLYGDN
jgi:hypothetical protein